MFKGPYICDVRAGAVAVYRGPQETCFAHLGETVYYGGGKAIYEGDRFIEWTVPLRRVIWAYLVCWSMNLRATVAAALAKANPKPDA